MYLNNSKMIVIKIGSSLLVDDNKKIRKKWLSSFAKDVQRLKSKNKKIIIVSSGAIALGCKKMNFNKTNLKIEKSQAIASIGQIELMNLFSKTFFKYKLNMGNQGSKNVDWGDSELDIPDKELLNLPREIIDRMVHRMHSQNNDMQKEFTEKLFDSAESVVNRILDSPLLSPENKQQA